MPYPITAGPAVFFGIEIMDTLVTLVPSSSSSLKFEFYGASDSAGFGIERANLPLGIDCLTNMIAKERCDLAFTSLIANHFNAEIHLQAIAGAGLHWNANSILPFGPMPTIPDSMNRTLGTDENLLWNFDKYIPDVVFLSVGGNDFNNLSKVVYSKFKEGYHRMIDYIFK